MQEILFDILFLPLVLFLGLITSYEDLKCGKVRNKWILLGVSWGIMTLFMFYAWSLVAVPTTEFFYSKVLKQPVIDTILVFTVRPAYLAKILINALISLLIGFFMWRAGAWAAGDAKLFTTYSLLIPLRYYWKTPLPFFYSFALLINIFIPILVYLLIRAGIHCSKKACFRPKRALQKGGKKKLKAVNLLKRMFSVDMLRSRMARLTVMLAFLFFFSSLAQTVNEHFHINVSWIASAVMGGWIIFSKPLSKIFAKLLIFKTIFAIFILLLAYGFGAAPQVTWQLLARSLKMMIILMLILTSVRQLIEFYINETGFKKIPIRQLAPRMNLSEKFLNRIRKKDAEYYRERIGTVYPGGLNVKQVEAVKSWFEARTRNKPEMLEIGRPFPFVLWMFLGVIITLVLRGSIIHVLIQQL